MRFHSDSTSTTSRSRDRAATAANRKGRRRDDSVARAACRVIERLEGRQLMAVLNGGEVGFFQNAQNQPVRVTVDGDGSFAFVGSTRDDITNQAFLNDIPMTVFDALTGQVIRENLGGYAGRDGIELITDITGDTGTDGSSVIRPYDANGLPNGPVYDLEGLASNGEGRTFGLSLTNGPGTFNLNLVYLNPSNANVRSVTDISTEVLNLLQAREPGIGAGDIERVIGADFNPGDDSQLYFALNVTYPFPNGTGVTDAVVPAMFIYDTVSKQVTLADTNFFGISDPTTLLDIDDFTFVDDDQIAFFGSVAAAGAGGGSLSGIFTADVDALRFDGFTAVVEPAATPGGNATPVTSVAAIEFIDGQDYFIAVSNRTQTAELLRIELNAGGGQYISRSIGNAVDPDQAGTNRRGGNIGDLDYNNRISDTFFRPGRNGVLIGADVASNELVGFDTRDRFPSTDLYAIYGRDSDSETSLAISTIARNTANNRTFDQSLFDGVASPYTGGAGSLETFMTTQDDPQSIALGNGGLFIGGRVENGDDALVVPVYALDLALRRGDSTGGNLPDIVNPGIYIDGSMDNLFIGGTITGKVNISGSVDTMYAGNVVTGDVRIGTANGFGEIGSDNFFVGGDLRNLIVSGGIGTLGGATEIFEPGTDFAIGGKVGQIRAALEVRAGFDVVGKTGNGISDESDFEELETRGLNNTNALAIGLAFHGKLDETVLTSFVSDSDEQFRIVNQGFAANNSFATPQIVGSFRSDSRARGDQVQIRGAIINGVNIGDNADFYGVPLLAGQSIVVQIQLTPEDIELDIAANGVQTIFSTGATVQVIDPDGNVIASDASNQDTELFDDKAFSVTADQPGLWRVAIVPTDPTLLAYRGYQLTVDKMGAVALGGLASSGDIYLHNETIGVRVRNNDLGAILSGGDLMASDQGVVRGSRDATFTNPITSLNGNIRSVEGINFGGRVLPSDDAFLFPNIIARKTVGLVRANGVGATDGRLYFNIGTPSTTGALSSPNLLTGGDFQVIETQGDAAANIRVGGGVGVIRVGSWAAAERYFASYPSQPGSIFINADGRGSDGFLGLFDVEGDLGTFQNGGPAIDQGNGSNIRYIRVGGAAYRDRQFGIGQAFVDTLTDQSFDVTDDSGATVTLTPLGSQPYTAPEDEEPVDPTNPGTVFGPGVVPSPFGSGVIIPNPFGGGGQTTVPTTDVNGDGVIDADDLLVDQNGDGIIDEDDIVNDTNGDGVIDENDIPGQAVDENGNIPGTQVSGELIVETYPVRNGGRVILTVRVTEGLQINTAGSGGTASGDVTSIETGPGGALLTFGPDPASEFGFNTATGPVSATPTDEDDEDEDETSALAQFGSGTLLSGDTLEVLMTGIRTNVMEIGPRVGTANYTRIVNATDGEIVNLDAGDVAYLEAEWLGVARPAGGVAIEGLSLFNGFTGSVNVGTFGNPPPSQSFNRILMTDALEVRSRGPIGNIQVQGILQNAQANSDNVNVRGVFEGVVAPIYAAIDLHNADIGEGLAYSGSGEVQLSGLFAGNASGGGIGLIGNVTNRNGNGDLRGDVMAYRRIHSITLTGGASIANADILQIGSGTLADASATGFGLGLERVNYAINAGSSVDTDDGVGNISVEGNGGGIISALVVGFNHGITSVGSSGFGILNSAFVTAGGGRMGGLLAGGLGIRGTTYIGGSETGNIIATGNGNLANLSDYSLTTRASTFAYFDPSTGAAPNASTDLYLLFETSPAEDEIIGETNEGIIADSNFAGSGSIGVVRAFDFRTFNNPLGARPRDDNYPMQINFGEDIGAVIAKRDINGLSITSGTVGQIVARDIKSFQLQATAAVGTINAKRNISGSVNFNIINEGSLDQLLVGGNMNGTLFAAQGINRIVVDGDVASQYISGGIYSGQNIGTVRIGGDVREGSYIRARKRLGGITINGDLQATATIRANPFGTVTIKGDRLGTVRTG